jgi:ERF superfamily
MNAIAPIPANSNVPAEAPLADSLLNFVARAMADPAIDVMKLEMLLRMQREIVADDARLRFNRAMSLAQGEMQPVVRDAQNTQTNSRYALLETIDAAIRPIYVKHGFMLSFNSEAIDGPNERIICEVSHTAGHSKRYQLDAPLDTVGPQGKANKTPLHGLGSTVSYLRRYLTAMIFNIVLKNEDNDGNRQKPAPPNAANEERVNGLLLQKETAEIADLLKRLPKSDVDTFLGWHGLDDVRSIGQIAAKHFPSIKNELLKRLKVLTEREAFAARARATAARQPRYGARS